MTDPIIFKTNGKEGFRIPFSPSSFPYVGSKCPETKLEVKEMTEIDPSLILKYDDHIYYHGEKYQKVVEPKSFYDKLWEELGKKVGYGIDCDELTDRVMDLIKDNIPEPLENKYHSDIIAGYNNALNDIRERF
jgi:hypothetical protein